MYGIERNKTVSMMNSRLKKYERDAIEYKTAGCLH